MDTLPGRRKANEKRVDTKMKAFIFFFFAVLLLEKKPAWNILIYFYDFYISLFLPCVELKCFPYTCLYIPHKIL